MPLFSLTPLDRVFPILSLHISPIVRREKNELNLKCILELEWTPEIMELGRCKLKGPSGPGGHASRRAPFSRGPATTQLHAGRDS